MNLLIELRELIGDLLGGCGGLDVVVARVQHDNARLVRNHDSIGKVHGVADQRPAEAAVDRLAQLGKDSGRFQRTMLDAPTKTMPLAGTGDCRS